MKVLSVLLLCCACTFIHAQGNESFADDWKPHTVPANADTLIGGDGKGTDWMVYLNGEGKVCIKPEPKPNERKLPFVLPPARFGTKKYPGQKAFIEVDNGYLVSFTGGEYGDKLFWYAKDGQDNYIVAKPVIVNQFIQRDDKVYGIQVTDKGSVIEISKQNGKWVSSEVTKLPFNPDAVGMDGSKNFIIVTEEDLLSVSPAGAIKILIEEGFWMGLFPNSLIVKGELVYVGMRNGILRFNTKTKKQEWLTKD